MQVVLPNGQICNLWDKWIYVTKSCNVFLVTLYLIDLYLCFGAVGDVSGSGDARKQERSTIFTDIYIKLTLNLIKKIS